MQNYLRMLACGFLCLFMSKKLSAQQIKSEALIELTADLLRPAVLAGTKVIYPVTGGSFTGKIVGKVLPIGGDFATFTNATTLKLDVRLVLQTEDSANIYCTYTGYLTTDAETFKIIKSGKGFQVDPSKYYFRTNPIFETNSTKYEWLNHLITVGYGTITAEGVKYKIYSIQ